MPYPTIESASEPVSPQLEPPEVEPSIDQESVARQAVRRTLEDWARAWSEQRVEDYLAYYAPEFVPEGGSDRAAWERTRRERILGASKISIDLRDLEIDFPSEQAEARFQQVYTAANYSDTTAKVLVFESRQGDWRILSERSQ